MPKHSPASLSYEVMSDDSIVMSMLRTLVYKLSAAFLVIILFLRSGRCALSRGVAA